MKQRPLPVATGAAFLQKMAATGADQPVFFRHLAATWAFSYTFAGRSGSPFFFQFTGNRQGKKSQDEQKYQNHAVLSGSHPLLWRGNTLFISVDPAVAQGHNAMKPGTVLRIMADHNDRLPILVQLVQ